MLSRILTGYFLSSFFFPSQNSYLFRKQLTISYFWTQAGLKLVTDQAHTGLELMALLFQVCGAKTSLPTLLRERWLKRIKMLLMYEVGFCLCLNQRTSFMPAVSTLSLFLNHSGFGLFFPSFSTHMEMLLPVRAAFFLMMTGMESNSMLYQPHSRC